MNATLATLIDARLDRQAARAEYLDVLPLNRRILRKHIAAQIILLNLDPYEMSNTAFRRPEIVSARWRIVRIGRQLGMSINAIAAEMKLDRNSVRRAITREFRASDRRGWVNR